MKTVAQNVAFRVLPKRRGSNLNQEVVSLNGVEIGLITRFDPDCYTETPWQAFALDAKYNPPTPNTLIGSYYGRTPANGKQMAAQATVGYYLTGPAAYRVRIKLNNESN